MKKGCFNKEVILYILVLLVAYYFITNIHLFNKKEGFQSYEYPWWNRNGWAWNWWRRWYNPLPVFRPLRPRCPAGCRWVGGQQGFGCPNPSLAYGNFACKYDFDCKGCGWGL